jgi:hypothetical protein
MSSDEEVRAAEALAAQIAPLLAGKGSGVQGAALADLAAIWLSGHMILNDPGATTELRRELFDHHCRAVWDLVEHYDGRRRGLS